MCPAREPVLTNLEGQHDDRDSLLTLKREELDYRNKAHFQLWCLYIKPVYPRIYISTI